MPSTRGATQTDDWTIDVTEIALDETATIAIVNDSDTELTERVTFEVGLTGDNTLESSSATLNIVDDDTTGPALVFAEVDGLVLTLEYSTPLSTTSVPAAGDFTVKVDGAAVSLGLANPVSISGSTVTLRLAGSVVASNVVTVSYTAPTANPIQDMSNNNAPSFTDEPVTNNSPAIPNDAPTGMPTISGTAMESRTLTADTSAINDSDGLTNPGYTYQWIRVEGGSDVIIAGETSMTYVLTVDDVGHTVKVRVSFTDDATIVHSLLSDPYPATGTILALPNNEPTGRPTISGTPQVGETLTADATGIQDADGLTNRTFSYQWVRVDGADEDNITGATSNTYLLTNDDQGLKVKVEVRFVDDRGELEIVSSFAFPASGTIRPKPNRQPTGDPTLSGQYEVGHTLTASTSGIADLDGLTGVVYTYQWERLESGGYEDIEGADARLYTLTADDEGKRVRVKVTFDDDDGNRHSLTSDPTGAVQAQASIPPDKVEVSLGKTAYDVREGESVDITITLATAPDERVLIPYGFTRDGETSIYDYSTRYRGGTSASHLRFDAGQTEQRVTVIAEDDDLNDDGESLTFYLGEMPEGYAVLVGRNRATINIEDTDDPNSVQVYFRNANYYVHEDGGPVTVRVVMDPVPDREITIPITFTRGGGQTTLPGEPAYTFPGGGSLSAADHSTVTTSVTFGPEVHRYHNIPAYRDIEIWATDDSVDDDGEYMDITFGAVTDTFTTVRTGNNTCCSQLDGKVRPFNVTRVWFQDNDFTEVPVSNQPNPNPTMNVTFSADTYSAPEGGGVATVSVWLLRGGDLKREVTIPIDMELMGGASAADTDTRYSSIPSSITFKPGQTAQSFRVAAVDDSVDDDGEWLRLSFGALPDGVIVGDESTCDYGGCDHDTARVNLVDDDHPAVEVSFESASYETTRVERDDGYVVASTLVTLKLSQAPERILRIPFRYEASEGRGSLSTSLERIQPGQTEVTFRVSIEAWRELTQGQTFEVSFGGLPDRCPQALRQRRPSR